MPVDSLDEFELFANANPGSAELAARMFAHCQNEHGARLSWPSGKSGWIISYPNYFAFGAINQGDVSVMVEVYPPGRAKFIELNGVTEEQARELALRDVIRKSTGKAARTRFTVTNAAQLPIAFILLDEAYRLSMPRFQRQGLL